MELTIVSALILVGLVLIVIEVLFIPGTTVVGLVGFIFVVAGIWLSFNYFGTEWGWITLTGSSVVAVGILYLAFRTNAWARFSLRSSIQSKVNEGQHDSLSVGMTGQTASVLRPMGNAEIQGTLYELRTTGESVDSGRPMRIIRISENKIVVEPIN